ncbi:hypothetical protein B296_00008418 [Ensete ventricosum]|uniref:Uncharacterized protein n=1 Tax=Ensete ventricosum TaxID=4639 RepID=A0A427AND0_ENSVE|nr:hypothetical protein B296_00008418 [Ensete ventricosum]
MRAGSRYPKEKQAGSVTEVARYEPLQQRRYLFAGSGWRSPLSGQTGNTTSKNARVFVGPRIFWEPARGREVRQSSEWKHTRRRIWVKDLYLLFWPIFVNSDRRRTRREREVTGLAKGWIRLRAMAGAMLLLLDGTSRRYGFGSEAALRRLAERLGMWAIPAYVVAHAVALAVCLPNAVFFEVSASLLYGFLTAVLSVVSAKVLGASLSSCWIGRSVVSTTFVTFFLSFFHLLWQFLGAQNQQQSGHTAADTSISLPEELNAMMQPPSFMTISRTRPTLRPPPTGAEIAWTSVIAETRTRFRRRRDVGVAVLRYVNVPSIGSIAYTRNMAVQAQHLSNSTFSPDFRGW